MRKISAILSLCFFITGFSLPARELKDTLSVNQVKTGWNFGALPAISFDSDQGFQYGAAINFYHYGNGENFPKYNHSLYLEVSRFTKGGGVFRFYYDSDQLIKGIQLTTDLSFLPEQSYDFYGFNGYESVYNKSWVDQDSPDYRTRMFYKYKQNFFRFKTDLQGNLKGLPFRWIAGVNLLKVKSSSVDINFLNKGKSGDDILPSVEEQPGLYERYQQWGMINETEANGGFIPELKAGLVYDTRDQRANPFRGMWSEAVVAFAPEFLGAESGFSKISLTHRQYFPILKEDLSFAVRLGWQQTISGHAPFYYQPQIITSVLTGSSSSGLGGAKNLRGILRNRIVGDGFAYGNFELRWKFSRMNLFRQNFYWGLNGFMDFGRVTKRIDISDKLNSVNVPLADYFKLSAEKMHKSIGAGLRVAMNYNFIAAIDYGIALDEQDGDSGIYIGLNYLF